MPSTNYGVLKVAAATSGEVRVPGAEVRLTGEPGQRFGLLLTAGDFDGDGDIDLAVADYPVAGGAPAVHLFAGPLL